MSAYRTCIDYVQDINDNDDFINCYKQYHIIGGMLFAIIALFGIIFFLFVSNQSLTMKAGLGVLGVLFCIGIFYLISSSGEDSGKKMFTRLENEYNKQKELGVHDDKLLKVAKQELSEDLAREEAQNRWRRNRVRYQPRHSGTVIYL